jgi:hypothetical protein
MIPPPFSIVASGYHLYAHFYREDKEKKGGNNVVSMLHAQLTQLNLLRDNDTGAELSLFADNCGGQNKNNVLVRYTTSWVQLRNGTSLRRKLMVVESSPSRGGEAIYNDEKYTYHIEKGPAANQDDWMRCGVVPTVSIKKRRAIRASRVFRQRSQAGLAGFLPPWFCKLARTNNWLLQSCRQFIMTMANDYMAVLEEAHGTASPNARQFFSGISLVRPFSAAAYCVCGS